MNDTPPEWVLREAAERSKLSNDTPRQRAILFDTNPSFRALCDIILEHEAFRQEVSDAVVEYQYSAGPKFKATFERFIINKPDPLVEVVKGVTWYDYEITAKELRAALDAAGFEIREKAQ